MYTFSSKVYVLNKRHILRKEVGNPIIWSLTLKCTGIDIYFKLSRLSIKLAAAFPVSNQGTLNRCSMQIVQIHFLERQRMGIFACTTNIFLKPKLILH